MLYAGKFLTLIKLYFKWSQKKRFSLKEEKNFAIELEIHNLHRRHIFSISLFNHHCFMVL